MTEEHRQMLSKHNMVYSYEPGDRVNNLTVIEKCGKHPHGGDLYIVECICETRLSLASSEIHQYKGCGCRTLVSKCKYLTPTIFGHIKRRAAKYKKVFEVDIEYLEELYISQHRRCAITGIELAFSVGRYNKSTTASLDRIDSSKGYIKGNVWWVHKHVNFMKYDFTMDYFKELCHKVVEFKGLDSYCAA